MSYDYETGVFSIQVPKEREGQEFEGLDMITSLLSVPKQKVRHPLIQEVVGEGEEEVSSDQEDEGDGIEWCLEQVVSLQAETTEKWLMGEKYGFANSKSNVFQRLDEEVSLAIDVKDPESKSRGTRRQERLLDECARFDEHYYLSCLFEDQDAVTSLIQAKDLFSELTQFDDSDLYDMKNLPTRSYLLDDEEKRRLLFGLVDILFAYAYDLRTCEGEHTAESNWTISKLSATLSWLETFDKMTEVVISCYRRSLIFPLYRHHDLSVTIMNDVVQILRSGRKGCLKCLLDIRRLFNQTLDSKYILNDLFISDYCVWVQRVKDKSLEKVAGVLQLTLERVSKADLDLDLNLLERAARLAIQEQESEAQD